MKKLRLYQVNIIRQMRRQAHNALFVDMRLGKTLTLIRYIKILPNIKNILVLAPYSAIAGWKEELDGEQQAYKQILGTSHERGEQLAIGYEKHWSLANKESPIYVPKLFTINWDVVILDESTFIKSPRAKISKLLCKHFRQVKHRFILTGTPAPESDLDYFQQLLFLDPAILGFASFWDFRIKHCFADGNECKLKNSSRKWFTQRIAQHCIFLTRKDIGLNNEKIYERRTLKLSPKLQNLYTQMEKDFLMDLPDKTIQTMFAGAKWSLLRQLCGGFVEKSLCDSFKINALLELLKGELINEPLIIWCNFIHEIKQIKLELETVGVESYIICGEIKPKVRDQIRKGFQVGEYNVIIVQPEVWKYGTTLSRASAMIYFSSPTSGLTRSQTEDRTIDVEAQNSALIIDLVCENTVEEDILTGLKDKLNNDALTRTIMAAIQRRQCAKTMPN